MHDDPTMVLRELGLRYRAKVRGCKGLDANVCSWKPSSTKPWELLVTEGEPFSNELRFTRGSRRFSLTASSVYLRTTVSGNFPFRPFSINAPEKAGFDSQFAGERNISGTKYAVFTEDAHISNAQDTLLRDPAFISFAAIHPLESGESIHVNAGDIAVYMIRPNLDRVSSSIDPLLELAQRIEIPPPELDLESIPSVFHPLIPLVKKWAVGDDSERAAIMDDAPEGVLGMLVANVEPYLKSIDSYLDSFGTEPPTEGAVALGRLAECALEAKLRLQSKKA